jgi:hypothetical protein
MVSQRSDVQFALLLLLFFLSLSACYNTSTLSLIPDILSSFSLVYQIDFQLWFLFDLLSFSFPEFQLDFIQNYCVITEFFFHVLCCLYSFISLFEFSWNSLRHLFMCYSILLITHNHF